MICTTSPRRRSRRRPHAAAPRRARAARRVRPRWSPGAARSAPPAARSSDTRRWSQSASCASAGVSALTACTPHRRGRVRRDSSSARRSSTVTGPLVSPIRVMALERVGRDDLEVRIDVDRQLQPVAFVGGIERRSRAAGAPAGRPAAWPSRRAGAEAVPSAVVPVPAQSHRGAEEHLAQLPAESMNTYGRPPAAWARSVRQSTMTVSGRFACAAGVRDQPFPAEVFAPAEAAEVVVVVAEPAAVDRRTGPRRRRDPAFSPKHGQNAPADVAAAERRALRDEQRCGRRARHHFQSQVEVLRRDAQCNLPAVKTVRDILTGDRERPCLHHAGQPGLRAACADEPRRLSRRMEHEGPLQHRVCSVACQIHIGDGAPASWRLQQHDVIPVLRSRAPRPTAMPAHAGPRRARQFRRAASPGVPLAAERAVFPEHVVAAAYGPRRRPPSFGGDSGASCSICDQRRVDPR